MTMSRALAALGIVLAATAPAAAQTTIFDTPDVRQDRERWTDPAYYRNFGPLDADRRYKVAGWASVQERPAGAPIWEVVATYLRDRRVIPPQRLNVPRLEGVAGNPGVGSGAP